MIVIGDVHGKIDEYEEIIKNTDEKTLQLGDFGFAQAHLWHIVSCDPKKHKINFGNHDDYTFLNRAHSLGNFSYDEDMELMTIRGAFSIDKSRRTENVSWWAKEQMNYQEMQEAIDFYVKMKPKIVVSHDCPANIIPKLFKPGFILKTLTTDGLQSMLDQHKPEKWIFGHWHMSKDEVIDGTRFICLAELETLKI